MNEILIDKIGITIGGMIVGWFFHIFYLTYMKHSK